MIDFTVSSPEPNMILVWLGALTSYLIYRMFQLHYYAQPGAKTTSTGMQGSRANNVLTVKLQGAAVRGKVSFKIHQGISGRPAWDRGGQNSQPPLLQ